MIKFYAFLLSTLFSFSATAQSFAFPALLDLLNQPVHKAEAQILKKDFKREFDVPSETGPLFTSTTESSKGTTITRSVSLRVTDDGRQIVYQTSDKAESLVLLADLRNGGFESFASYAGNEEPTVFQKAGYTINTSIEIRDTRVLYTYLIEKTEVMHPKAVVYAEDLLQYTSHAQLTAAFGAGAVVRDVFYYTEKETNKCSILFPKTKREVIFVWDDEVNYRKLSFLVIGGNMETGQSKEYAFQVAQNTWSSEQGVYPGMSLKELQALNGQPLAYYGWGMEQAGMLAPKNTGNLDFTRFGIVLNCMNCKEKGYRTANIINSDEEVAADRKIYVSTLIILPKKEKAAVAAR